MGSKCLSKLLMDGGSGLNIMYINTFDGLAIARSTLHLSSLHSMTSCPAAKPTRSNESLCMSHSANPPTFVPSGCNSRWWISREPTTPSW